MKEFILIGSGGHALSCLDVIYHNGHSIYGYFDDQKINILNSSGYNLNFLGDMDECKKNLLKYDNVFFLIAFGAHNKIRNRADLYKNLVTVGCNFCPIVSSTSYISESSFVGPGTIVMHKCLINIGVEIRENCIINSGSIIDHQSYIGENSIISTNVTINGNVNIGKNSFVGSGAIIFNNINIGENVVISAGSVVKENIPNNKKFINENLSK